MNATKNPTNLDKRIAYLACRLVTNIEAAKWHLDKAIEKGETCRIRVGYAPTRGRMSMGFFNESAGVWTYERGPVKDNFVWDSAVDSTDPIEYEGYILRLMRLVQKYAFRRGQKYGGSTII